MLISPLTVEEGNAETNVKVVDEKTSWKADSDILDRTLVHIII